MRDTNRLLDYEAPNNRTGWLATVSILSIFYYLASLILLQALNGSVDPFTGGATHLSAGTDEHQVNAAFVLLGLGGMVLTIGLYLAVPAEVRAPAGLALLATWVATVVLAGIFPLDMLGASQTTADAIRAIAGMNFLCMAAAASFMVRHLKPGYPWQTLARIAPWLAHS
jgi:hypothetical protein